tara:strand:+ start:340 stop:720 length:381 start_codon:yes stop_codon:yes gene_type:complete
MKKLLLIACVVLTSCAYSQEFTRAFLHVNMVFSEDSVVNYESSNAFTFNVNGNSIKFFGHSGEINRYIYLEVDSDLKDGNGDDYSIIKTIRVGSSAIWYFFIYEYNVSMYTAEIDLLVNFYNLKNY